MAEQYNDEIDLGELMIKIKNVLVRNTIWIVGLTIGGLLCGLTFYLLKSPVYQSQVVVRADILNGQLLNILNENLNRIIEQETDTVLANQLNLSLEIAEEIQEINIKSAAEDNNSSFYVISIQSLSNENWNKLKDAIIEYLTNNDYVQKRVKIQEERYQSLISKLDEEISHLDSVKFNLANVERNNARFIVLNPSDTYSTLINLYQERQKYRELLAFNTAVELVEEFNAYEQPVSPKLTYSMGMGALIGLILSFVLVAFIELDGFLKRYEKA